MEVAAECAQLVNQNCCLARGSLRLAFDAWMARCHGSLSVDPHLPVRPRALQPACPADWPSVSSDRLRRGACGGQDSCSVFLSPSCWEFSSIGITAVAAWAALRSLRTSVAPGAVPNQPRVRPDPAQYPHPSLTCQRAGGRLSAPPRRLANDERRSALQWSHAGARRDDTEARGVVRGPSTLQASRRPAKRSQTSLSTGCQRDYLSTEEISR